MNNLNWKHYSIAALILAVLAAWGSRERSWSKQVDEMKNEKIKLTESLAIQRTQNEQLRKDTETSEVTEPMVVKVNGKDQVVMVTRKTSKTVETAIKQATEQVAILKDQITDLQVKLSSKEKEVIKSSPLWNIAAGWEPLAGGYYLGAGMNLGPISMIVDNPVSMELKPKLTAMIRF